MHILFITQQVLLVTIEATTEQSYKKDVPGCLPYLYQCVTKAENANWKTKIKHKKQKKQKQKKELQR